MTLAPDPRSVTMARRFARLLCEECALDDFTCDATVLLVSETVTNAIVHARSEVRLKVTASAVGTRVEVSDEDSRLPVLQSPGPHALGGRGLALMAATATNWGVATAPLGKTVWFEVHATTAPAPQ